jgi:hypothetical protein
MYSSYSGSASSVNPPSAAVCSVSIYTGYADFRGPSVSSKAPSAARGDRRSISVFSKGARRNFLKKVFSLSALPDLFITLTYPGFYSADPMEWKRHLDNFSREFLRHFPRTWFFWKLEPQRRGAPHFHLICSLGKDRVPISLLRQFIAKTWFRIVDSGDVRHLRAGTQADYIDDSFGKIRAYVCKYVGKSTTGSDLPQWATPGRFWGIVGRKNLPPATCCHVLLPRDTFFKLRRLVRNWMKRFASSDSYVHRLRRLPSFFVLAQHATLFRLLEGALGFLLPQTSNPLTPEVLDLEVVPF